MATWTNIADARLEPGKPARSVDAVALRDNPIAIAEGAPDAPRIQIEAFQPPAAGTIIVGGFWPASASITRTGNVGSATAHGYSALVFRCLVAGTVRLTCACSISGSTSGGLVSWSALVEFQKNGVGIGSRSSSGTLTVDVAVAAGDVLRLHARATASSSSAGSSATASASTSYPLVMSSTGQFAGVIAG